MLANDGFLRGLWVSVLAVPVWGGAVRDNRVGLDVAADAVDIPAGDAGCRISENRPR